jgi:hypothetical protein
MIESSEDLDVPRLPRQEGNYRDPNKPLPLDREGILQLSPNHFVSERTLILGQTGKGKGNAGALITEFLLEAGLPLTFIDLEGEGYSFREICSSLLIVGRSAHADREYLPAQMGRLAELSVEQGFSVILDLSGYADEEQFALVTPYLQSLWATCERLRTPYHLILDEAHELVPEEGTTPVKAWLRRIAKRGRKRGLGILAMSQETASLDKKFLRQMDIRIMLSVSYEADLKIYHTLIPGISLDTLRNTMPAFPPGTGYVVFKHQPYLVHLLRRRTFDPSETPKLGDQRVAPILHTMDQQTLNSIDQTLPTEQNGVLEGLDRATLMQLVRELRHLQNEGQEPLSLKELRKAVEAADPVQKNEKQFEEHIQQLEAQLTRNDTIIARQAEQIALLSQLTVRMEGTLPNTLEIDQANIRQVHVPGPAIVSSSAHVMESPSAPEPPVVTSQATPFNEAKWDSLQKRFRQVPQLEKAILRVLIEQRRSLTISEIAAWLKMSESHLQNHPPSDLLRLKMVTRTRESHGYLYRSTLIDYLRREFPGMDSEQLQARLLR